MVIDAQTAEDVASALARASAQRRSVALRGGGTKAAWGRPARPADATVSTRHLNRVLAHEHGDLVATIEAGATLRDVNAQLARHGQWLPPDPPFHPPAPAAALP